MSNPAVHATTQEAHAAHELSFVRTYVFSTDHKMVARQFLFLGLFMMIIGGLLAMLIRWQLAWPETPVPGLGWLLRDTEGVLPPEAYNMAFTMHATLMIFFVIMPILAGAFGNFCIPLMIGARDMAFPRLNMVSIWMAFLSGAVMVAGFFVPPEVSILILPAMGAASEILPVFARKPIFGYHAMVYSMLAICFLSWIVYGHHMFVSGMNPAVSMAFTVSTMVIAVPSAIKT